MIAFLTGRVAARGAGSAVIDVGGVGMTVQCTPSALSRLHVGDEGTVATSLVVREDSLTLFGFVDDDEKHVFEQVQTASGVGPRLARRAQPRQPAPGRAHRGHRRPDPGPRHR